jgi:hypothetical protein
VESIGIHISSNVGLLLKAETVGESDRENLGVLMVLLLVSVFAAVIGAMMLEVAAVVQWARPVWHAFGILYEGNIRKERGIPCISSFPGQYLFFFT